MKRVVMLMVLMFMIAGCGGYALMYAPTVINAAYMTYLFKRSETLSTGEKMELKSHGKGIIDKSSIPTQGGTVGVIGDDDKSPEASEFANVLKVRYDVVSPYTVAKRVEATGEKITSGQTEDERAAILRRVIVSEDLHGIFFVSMRNISLGTEAKYEAEAELVTDKGKVWERKVDITIEIKKTFPSEDEVARKVANYIFDVYSEDLKS